VVNQRRRASALPPGSSLADLSSAIARIAHGQVFGIALDALAWQIIMDGAFRNGLALNGVKILGAASLHLWEHAYTLAVPSSRELWLFIDAHLGPVADRDMAAFLAHHVRRVEPRLFEAHGWIRR
jgi:hypothetical protein